MRSGGRNNLPLDGIASQVRAADPNMLAHPFPEAGRRASWETLIKLSLVLLLLPPARAAGADQPVELTPALGAEIDPHERDEYGLLPSIRGFSSARFLLDDHGRYVLAYQYVDGTGTHDQRLRISTDTWEMTKLHARLVETYNGRRGMPVESSQAEAEWQYRTALKYAARGRYDFSRLAINDLFDEFPESPVTRDAVEARESIVRLAGSTRGLFLPGSLFDRGGRTDLLIFAGYYGLWAGIATPAALSADSPQAYAVGLIFGAPLSLFVAHEMTKNTDMSQGRASMISLGGHLGTWQGIGWAAVSDAEGEVVVGAGLLAGLGGIAAAALLTRDANITDGHGALSGLSLPWGMWFGLVAGIIGGAEDEDLLTATLVGSDVFVLGTLVAARNNEMTRGRARLISLLGVAGAAFGFGLDLLAEVDSEEAAFAIAGAGSVAGLAVGVHVTRSYDAGRDLGMGPPRNRWGFLSGVPELGFRRDPFTGGLQPAVSLGWRF